MKYWDFIDEVFKLTGNYRYPGETADVKLKTPIVIDNNSYHMLSIWIDDDDDCRGRVLADLYENIEFSGYRIKLYELSEEQFDELFEICKNSI